MKVGDLVEVKIAKYSPTRGRNYVIEWVPATVTAVTDRHITVVFKAGHLIDVERGRNKFRRIKRG